jgi:hypothetical protein
MVPKASPDQCLVVANSTQLRGGKSLWRTRRNNKNPFPLYIVKSKPFYIFPPKELLSIICTINILKCRQRLPNLDNGRSHFIIIFNFCIILVSGQGPPHRQWILALYYNRPGTSLLTYNDVRPGTAPTTLYVRFIYPNPGGLVQNMTSKTQRLWQVIIHKNKFDKMCYPPQVSYV